MKTTLNIDDRLLKAAKRRAAEDGSTLTAVVEDALREKLFGTVVREGYKLDWPVIHGDGPPTVDPADRQALYDLLDRDRDEKLYGKRKRKS